MKPCVVWMNTDSLAGLQPGELVSLWLSYDLAMALEKGETFDRRADHLLMVVAAVHSPAATPYGRDSVVLTCVELGFPCIETYEFLEVESGRRDVSIFTSSYMVVWECDEEQKR